MNQPPNRSHRHGTGQPLRACILQAAIVFSFTALFPIHCRSAEITPLYTFNQSPLVQIFGLPAMEKGRVTPSGHVSALLAFDAASNFGGSKNLPREEIVLDGETYRTTLALRYGIARNFEIGIDIPWLVESGGFLDGGVAWFHDTFGILQNGRELAPANQLLYSYSREGIERFSVTHTNNGIGDIRLSAAVQVFQDENSPESAVSIRTGIKLPTGESNTLHGSGSTDFSLWITGTDVYDVGIGHLAVFGGAGGMVLSKGDVLQDLQRELVGFGSIGLGWSPVEWFAVKSQLYVHSPFYHRSSLRELAVTTLQWLWGFTFAFTQKTSLDIGVSEDVLVTRTSPDVAFNFVLRTQF